MPASKKLLVGQKRLNIRQLLGTVEDERKQVRQWLERMLSLNQVDRGKLICIFVDTCLISLLEFLSLLNEHLMFRSFLVGYQVTLADIMVFSLLHYQHTLETLDNAKYRYVLFFFLMVSIFTFHLVLWLVGLPIFGSSKWFLQYSRALQTLTFKAGPMS